MKLKILEGVPFVNIMKHKTGTVYSSSNLVYSLEGISQGKGGKSIQMTQKESILVFSLLPTEMGDDPGPLSLVLYYLSLLQSALSRSL